MKVVAVGMMVAGVGVTESAWQGGLLQPAVVGLALIVAGLWCFVR